MAAADMALPVPPQIARQAPAQQRPITDGVPQPGASDPGSMQQLMQHFAAFEKGVGEIYQMVSVVAPQLLPLLGPIAQAGKALKGELSNMAGQSGEGGASQNPGSPTGESSPQGNSSSPGSVMAAA